MNLPGKDASRRKLIESTVVSCRDFRLLACTGFRVSIHFSFGVARRVPYFPTVLLTIDEESTMEIGRSMSVRSLWLVLLLSNVIGSWAFVVRTPSQSSRHAKPTLGSTCLHLAQEDKDEQVADMNPLTRASWYAVEAFGKAFGSKDNGPRTLDEANLDLTKSPQSMQETLQRIQLDNDRSYFLSGNVDKLIYDQDCVFADPFVSFSGRDRFVDNLANLGSFITKYSAKMIDYTVDESTVNTKVRPRRLRKVR